MELDQLKDIWKGLEEEVVNQKTDEQITAMLKKRSNSPISKIKRNLRIEFWIMAVTYSIMIVYYFFAFEGKLSEVSWFMLLIAVFFFVYYYRKNKLLTEMQCVTEKVKSNLERQVNILEKYVRFYLIAGTMLVPLCVLFFGFLFDRNIGDDSHNITFRLPERPWWKTTLIWGGLITALTIPVYFLNKWTVKKLYGNHIRKLRMIINELSEPSL